LLAREKAQRRTLGELGDHGTRISVRLLEPERALTTLRLSAPFTRMSLFGPLGAGSGSSTIRSPFVILSHSLARLERMRSNLLPTGGAELESHRPDIALPVLAGERRPATFHPGCAQGANVNAAAWALIFFGPIELLTVNRFT
jgi:hypothetical protein